MHAVITTVKPENVGFEMGSIRDNGIRELSDAEIYFVSGAFSWEGFAAATVAGAVTGGMGGSIAPGVGTAAGALAGSLIGAAGYLAHEIVVSVI